MKRFRQLLSLLLSLLLAASLLLGSAAFAEATGAATAEGRLTIGDIQRISGGTAKVVTDDGGNLTFIGGTCTEDPVRSEADAARIVASMTALLGGDERMDFEPWRTLTDANGNRYYVFQQMSDGITVSGGAIKVVTDADGKMLGLVSSVETDLPDADGAEGISAGQAESLVLDRARETQQDGMAIIEGRTEKIIIPLAMSVDIENEEQRSRYVWVVYTNNSSASVDRSSDLPYLAHYVTLKGEYLYSLPTIMPGDEVSGAGFGAGYVFEFMEPAAYRGMVTLSDGTETEIDVTLMRDSRTGMYYLGNIERRIVVGDCYEFLYNGGAVVLESSPDNREWDAVGLLSLYNYCRAWDYYNAIGWTGGDGKQTPIMVLNDFCSNDRKPVDNACYIGKYLGWQLFAASSANDFSQCLDIIAHEFTHCVTDSLMTYNAYMNDYGAINEAISDIQGNVCEMLMGATDDIAWEIGEHGTEPVRSMSDPHKYDQPEFSWDLYYRPNVKTPTPVNDQGGVHSNSSLLNNAAYRLCANGGMTLEEARAYWFAVDCAMVPGTDYAQLKYLLPWVLRCMGMERYETALQEAIDRTRLGDSTLPDSFDADRALITMTLPDTEMFADGNWSLQIASVDINGAVEKVKQLYNKIRRGDTDDLPELIREVLAPESAAKAPEEEGTPLARLINALFSGEEETVEAQPEPADDPRYAELLDWLRSEFGELFYFASGAAGQDGQTVRMVCRPGRTIPLLMHVTVDEIGMDLKNWGIAVYMNDRWYNLTDTLLAIQTLPENESKDDRTLPTALGEDTLDEIVNDLTAKIEQAESLQDMVDLVVYRIRGGQVSELSNTGLEDIDTLVDLMDFNENAADSDVAGPRQKSRPIDDEAAPAA